MLDAASSAEARREGGRLGQEAGKQPGPTTLTGLGIFLYGPHRHSFRPASLSLLSLRSRAHRGPAPSSRPLLTLPLSLTPWRMPSSILSCLNQ